MKNLIKIALIFIVSLTACKKEEIIVKTKIKPNLNKDYSVKVRETYNTCTGVVDSVIVWVNNVQTNIKNNEVFKAHSGDVITFESYYWNEYYGTPYASYIYVTCTHSAIIVDGETRAAQNTYTKATCPNSGATYTLP